MSQSPGNQRDREREEEELGHNLFCLSCMFGHFSHIRNLLYSTDLCSTHHHRGLVDLRYRSCLTRWSWPDVHGNAVSKRHLSWVAAVKRTANFHVKDHDCSASVQCRGSRRRQSRSNVASKACYANLAQIKLFCCWFIFWAVKLCRAFLLLNLFKALFVYILLGLVTVL